MQSMLSTEIKTHVVVTFTGVHYLITQNQYNVLSKMGNKQELTVEGNIIKTNNIADILTLEKYYETYPNKKPIVYPDIPEHKREVFNKAQLVRALESMIFGFENYFNGRELPPQSQKILDNMKKRLAMANEATDNKKFDNPMKIARMQFLNE